LGCVAALRRGRA